MLILRRIGYSLLQLIPAPVHLLLNDHFEGLCHRAALGRVSQGYFAHQLRIRKIGPLLRNGIHPESIERIAIAKNSVTGNHGADPTPLLVPVFFTIVTLWNHRVAEPFRVPLFYTAINESPGCCLLGKIERSTANEQVDSTAYVAR